MNQEFYQFYFSFLLVAEFFSRNFFFKDENKNFSNFFFIFLEFFFSFANFSKRNLNLKKRKQQQQQQQLINELIDYNSGKINSNVENQKCWKKNFCMEIFHLPIIFENFLKMKNQRKYFQNEIKIFHKKKKKIYN